MFKVTQQIEDRARMEFRPRNSSPKRVLVCPLVCILRGRGWSGGDWRAGEIPAALKMREGMDCGPQAIGSRGMAKGTSREKEY